MFDELTDIVSISDLQGFLWLSAGFLGQILPSTLEGIFKLEYTNISVSGETAVSEHKIPQGKNFHNFIFNEPLKISLSRVVIGDVFGITKPVGKSDTNYGLIILQGLRMIQRKLPLLFISTRYSGAVVMTNFIENVDGNTCTYDIELQQIDIVQDFEELEFSAELGEPEPIANYNALVNPTI